MSRSFAARVLLVLTTALATVVVAGPAYACSCASPPADPAVARRTHAQHADAVFYGEVVQSGERPAVGATSDQDVPVVAVVRVSRVYKGRVRATQEVVTGRNSGMCGLGVMPTGPALFFASASAGGLVRAEPGQLSTSLCSGTQFGVGPPTDLGPHAAPIGAVVATPTTPTTPASSAPASSAPPGESAAATGPAASREHASERTGRLATAGVLATGAVGVLAAVALWRRRDQRHT